MKKGKVWNPPKKIESLYEMSNSNIFSAINSPISGKRYDKVLKIGDSDFQLYSLATPNGQKVSIMLEELMIPYDAHTISINKGEQFSSGFIEVNPNNKIPAATDNINNKPLRLFESGSILIYLAEKYQKLIPSVNQPFKRAECFNWVNWAQVQAFVTGNYGHFFVYAPDEEISTRNYGVNRYGMEVQRLCSVLNNHLSDKKYILGDEYSIADISIFPWFHLLRSVGYIHKSGVSSREFLSIDQYKNLNRWADEIFKRKQVQRGLLVCRKTKSPKLWLDVKDKRYQHLRYDHELPNSKL